MTIDAMGCQTKIAQAIRDAKTDYLLRVKANQANLHQDIEAWFAHSDQQDCVQMQLDYAETVNKTNGRIEIRRCWAIADPLAFEYIRHYAGWADLHTIVRLQRECRLNGVTSKETAYYISSLPNQAAQLLEATRSHWVLDVTFRQDDSHIRIGDSPQNMAVLRHLALNILKQDTSKSSLKQKRFPASLAYQYLMRLP